MNRKQRRTLNKLTKNDEAASSVDLMVSLSDQCLTCYKPYDKMNREMVMTWFVEVYKAQKRVYLYCPDCYKNRSQNEQK